MRRKTAEVDHLQENILRSVTATDQELASKAFRKVGHSIMYHHLNIPFGHISAEQFDSIEEDLTYESLQNTNCPERYLLVVLGGVVMEGLVNGLGKGLCTMSELDIDKAMLLIRIQNGSRQMSEPEDDAMSFAAYTSQVGVILLKYQKEVGVLFHLLMVRKRLSYSDVILQIKNTQG